MSEPHDQQFVDELIRAGWSPSDPTTYRRIKMLLLEFKPGQPVSIEGIECLTSLVDLSLGGGPVTDLHRLRSLPQLLALRIDPMPAPDPSFLNSLVNLTNLRLYGTPLPNLSFVTGMPSLTIFAADGTGIADLSPLTPLVKLNNVWLGSNKITDLSPLVANPGFASGDRLSIENNPLDCTSQRAKTQALEARGVTIIGNPCM